MYNMLIDKMLETLEEHVACAPDDLETQALLRSLWDAQAYDIGGVHALVLDYQEKEESDSLKDDVLGHPDTDEALKKMGSSIWLEGVPECSYGCLITLDRDAIPVTASFLNPDNGWKRFAYSAADKRWRVEPTGEIADNGVRPWAVLLLTTAYLASNPKCRVVTLQPPRPAKRNKRGTKLLRRQRKHVRTIVIDGVERIYESASRTVTYRVHSRPRRHKVKEHSRTYASGKVVTVKAHERGDASKGYVPWFDGAFTVSKPSRRFRVQPDTSFFTVSVNR